MTQDLTLLQALTAKMDWVETRQKVLAQNIANADTPGYQPQELKPLEFKELLSNSTSKISLGAAQLATTDTKHLTSGGASGSTASPKGNDQKVTYETSPAKNAVVLEEQLLKMSENMADHRLITNLYQKNIDMLKLATRSQ